MKENSSISKDVAFGILPAGKNDKILGFGGLLSVQLGISLSCFWLITGAYTGVMLNARDAIVAIFFGNAIPILLIAPITIFLSRYGIDTFVAIRSALGYLGSKIVWILFAVMTLGIIAFMLYMSGMAIVQLLALFNINNIFTTMKFGVPFFCILIVILSIIIASKGPVAIKYFTMFGAPAMLVLFFVLLGVILFNQGIDKVFALEPAQPYETHERSLATAIELNAALAFSWLLYFGQYARLAKSEKIAFNSTFLSWGIGLCTAATLAVFMALITGSLNPAVILSQIGGTTLSVLALGLLIFGNVTGIAIMMYTQSISMKTVFPKLSWKVALSINLLVIFLIITPTLYNSWGIFITCVSFMMSALASIIITDFFIVKKQNISIKDLYKPDGIYRYWHGFNPAAWLSMLVGITCYWLLYNPILDEPSRLFYYITAGIPTYIITGVCYYTLSKYIFVTKASLNQIKLLQSEGLQKNRSS